MSETEEKEWQKFERNKQRIVDIFTELGFTKQELHGVVSIISPATVGERRFSTTIELDSTPSSVFKEVMMQYGSQRARQAENSIKTSFKHLMDIKS